ncbi:MAG TPA: twitching motility protein PilT [Lachnospiraceae bacterium]|jgi:predicted transcriptional regulator YheO|nr:twitching motility protein PilT [Lachnospiraceae bacterium]
MIQFIIGEKGRGKTKVLLEKANNEIKNVSGNVVYLDKSTQHMYELNNKIRLIDMTNFPIKDSDEFLGFICGIISQDHDLEYVYLDSFLKIAKLEENGDPVPVLKELEDISKQFGVHFVVSISLTKQQLPEQYHDAVIAEL